MHTEDYSLIVNYLIQKNQNPYALHEVVSEKFKKSRKFSVTFKTYSLTCNTTIWQHKYKTTML